MGEQTRNPEEPTEGVEEVAGEGEVEVTGARREETTASTEEEAEEDSGGEAGDLHWTATREEEEEEEGEETNRKVAVAAEDEVFSQQPPLLSPQSSLHSSIICKLSNCPIGQSKAIRASKTRNSNVINILHHIGKFSYVVFKP